MFDWGGGGEITHHLQCRHQKFSKEELFEEQRYRAIERLSRSLLAHNQDLAEGKELLKNANV